MEGNWLRDWLAAWLMIAFGWEHRCRRRREPLWVSLLTLESRRAHVCPRDWESSPVCSAVSDWCFGCAINCRIFEFLHPWIQMVNYNSIEITDLTHENSRNHVRCGRCEKDLSPTTVGGSVSENTSTRSRNFKYLLLSAIIINHIIRILFLIIV